MSSDSDLNSPSRKKRNVNSCCLSETEVEEFGYAPNLNDAWNPCSMDSSALKSNDTSLVDEIVPCSEKLGSPRVLGKRKLKLFGMKKENENKSINSKNPNSCKSTVTVLTTHASNVPQKHVKPLKQMTLQSYTSKNNENLSDTTFFEDGDSSSRKNLIFNDNDAACATVYNPNTSSCIEVAFPTEVVVIDDSPTALVDGSIDYLHKFLEEAGTDANSNMRGDQHPNSLTAKALKKELIPKQVLNDNPDKKIPRRVSETNTFYDTADCNLIKIDMIKKELRITAPLVERLYDSESEESETETEVRIRKYGKQKKEDLFQQQTPEGYWNPLFQSFAEGDPRNEELVDARFIGQKRNLKK